MDLDKIEAELEDALEGLTQAIATTEHDIQEWVMGSKFEAKDSNGRPLLGDMYATKALTLVALVELRKLQIQSSAAFTIEKACTGCGFKVVKCNCVTLDPNTPLIEGTVEFCSCRRPVYKRQAAITNH